MIAMLRKIAPYLLVAPALLLIASLVMGLSSLLGWSFLDGTSANTASFTQYESLLANGSYRHYFSYSLWLAVISTAIALVLGFPVAYYMEVVASPKQRKIIFASLLGIFLSDYVLRMFGLILILGRSGLVNRVAGWLGVADGPLKLMYNEFGVMVGLVAGILPFMILSLNGVVARLDKRLREAAALLGSPPWRTFVSITLPLCIPGILAGTMLSFLLSLNSFVTPMLLGGGRVDMVAVFIFDQAINLANLPLGSAAALILFLLSAAVIVMLNVLGDRYLKRFQR
jgi:putative spermidine/putrescine transport system permease protein